MKISVVLWLSLSLLGCNTLPQVFVNARYLSESQTHLIVTQLEYAGFTVETNTFEIPSQVQHSGLVYSPFIQDNLAIQKIEDVLAQLHWSISTVQPLVAGNQWFTHNSVGLFLIPDGIDPHNNTAQQDLANEYQSQQCQISAKVRLDPDNSYQFSFDEQPNQLPQALTGSWKITRYPNIEFTSDNKKRLYYFEVHTTTEVDQISEIQIVELRPMDNYDLFGDCTFIFGLRI
ncbi:MAG: hypothetical protein ACJA13_000835 [Paraglaciecola sp.]|jgi:hypothetical protein